MTRAEARKQRKELERQIAADLKAKAKRKLLELAQLLKDARATRGLRLREARSACARSRRLLARRRKERRARLFAELKEIARQEREAARTRCDAGKSEARVAAKTAVERAAKELAEEREYQRALKRIEANNRRQRIAVVKPTRAQRRSESDDEVLANLEPELVPLWQRIGSSIRGSSRLSRTEAFLAYAHDHPDEVIAAQEDRVDDTIAELERKMNEVRPYARAPKRRRYSAAELAEVPF